MTPQDRALDAFFRSAVQNLEAAGQAVVNSRAQELKQLTQGELKSQFRRRVGGVKVYSLPPTGDLGPAAYVSVKPRFLKIFEEGGDINSQGKFLVVRLPEGQRLKLPRPGKAGLDRILAANQGKFRWVKSGSGWVILWKTGRNKEVPVYLLTRQVKLKKRLNFGENAEKVGAGMAEEIAKLVEGRL